MMSAQPQQPTFNHQQQQQPQTLEEEVPALWFPNHQMWSHQPYLHSYFPLSTEYGAYSQGNMGYYKYGYSDPYPTQYYSYNPSYEAVDHLVGIDEYNRRDSDFPSTMTTEQTTTIIQQSERASNTNIRTRNQDCPRSHHNSPEYQAIWQDNIDPDHMSYEELLELGETVGTHSRGLSLEQISVLPVSKFRCCFLRRKSRLERCVICQMEYKRGARLITLPCKHKYHVGCGTKWLSINKACPICYSEVPVDGIK